MFPFLFSVDDIVPLPAPGAPAFWWPGVTGAAAALYLRVSEQLRPAQLKITGVCKYQNNIFLEISYECV